MLTPGTYNGIKSIQRGVLNANSAATYAITISAVNTAKSQLSVQCIGSSTATGVVTAVSVTLTNSTTITVVGPVSPTNVVFGWEVIEWY